MMLTLIWAQSAPMGVEALARASLSSLTPPRHPTTHALCRLAAAASGCGCPDPNSQHHCFLYLNQDCIPFKSAFHVLLSYVFKIHSQLSQNISLGKSEPGKKVRMMSPVFPKDSPSSPYRMQSHFHELLGNFLFIYPGFQTNPDSCPAWQGQQPIWPEEPSGPELRVTHLKPSHPSDPCPWRAPGCCRWRRRAPPDQRETPAGYLPARDGWHPDLSLQQSRPISPSLGSRGQNCGDSSGGRNVPPLRAQCVHRRPTDRPTDTSPMQTHCQARIGTHTQALAVLSQGLLYTHFLFLLWRLHQSPARGRPARPDTGSVFSRGPARLSRCASLTPTSMLLPTCCRSHCRGLGALSQTLLLCSAHRPLSQT